MKSLNETAPQIMPKNNIVIIQCMFGDVLTSHKLNLKSNVISPKDRNGLDFEIYYQLDGSVVRKLLDTTLFATNCVNWRSVYDKDQIIDILAQYKPFACFLTDSYGNQIGDQQVMSPDSYDILYKNQAQDKNFSIFRFSYNYKPYNTIRARLYYWKNTKEFIDMNQYIQNYGRGANLISFYPKDNENDRHSKKELGELNPFMLAGYWDGIQFDGSQPGWQGRVGEFVKNSDIAAPFVQRLHGNGNDRRTVLLGIIDSINDVDPNSTNFVAFLENVVNTANRSGKDLRTKIHESDWIERVAHMLDESMLEK